MYNKNNKGPGTMSYETPEKLKHNLTSLNLHLNMETDTQERIYPFQRSPAYYTTAEQFALKEFMRGCIKAMYLPILYSLKF